MADSSSAGMHHSGAVKRPHQDEPSGDGSTGSKQQRLQDTTSKGKSSSVNGTTQKLLTGSTLKGETEDSFTYTPHRRSFEIGGEPLKKVDSQKTVVFDSQDTEENSDCELSDPNSPSLLGNTESELSKNEDHTETTQPASVQKIESVQADAEKISELLGRADVKSLYVRLKAQRSDPQRVEKVTNECLEEGDAGNNDGASNSSDNRKEDIDNAVTKETPTGSSSSDVKSVISDISSVMKEMKTHYPYFDMDPNEVYMRLESTLHLPDRVKIVVDMLIQEEKEKHGETSHGVDSTGEDDIFQQVQRVLLKHPETDANRVFNLLEVFAEEPNCMEKVMEHLAKSNDDAGNNKSDGDNKATGAMPKAPVRVESFKNDPLYKDMVKLAKIFPDRSDGEIYAHLEVYHDKVNRIDLVMEEFLGSGTSQNDSLEMAEHCKLTLDSVDNEEVVMAAAEPEESDIVLLRFKQDVDTLKAVFPDCDHKHIIKQLQEHFEFDGRVDMVTAILMNQPNYPRVKKSTTSEILRQRLRNLPLEIPEFLKMFPNPTEVFYDETKEMSKVYKDHAKVQLCSEFKAWKKKYLKRKLESHNNHFLPALREIQTDMIVMGPEMANNMADEEDTRTRTTEDWPEEVDEFFYRELLFAKHEDKILSYIRKRTEARAQRLELARQNNDLQECQCCFDDEVLPEDLSACPEGHLFCNECVVRSVESALTEGKATYPCLTGTCDTQYSLSLLQDILPDKSFSHVVRRTQEEELRQADIPDLVTCPFCPFATVMPDENDKILRCLNPDCLKESCRLCKELNHIPQRCDEIEKSDEIKMRTFIENKMAEAMMRTCHQCKKKFYKIEGCNKMTCVCGASMCYVCREPITDYNHFNNNKRCNEGHMVQLHNREAEAAALRAREEYLKDHPEVKDLELKHDPLQGIKKGTDKIQNFNNQGYGDYDNEDDDDDEDDDEDEDGYDDDEHEYSEDDDEYDHYGHRYDNDEPRDSSSEDEW